MNDASTSASNHASSSNPEADPSPNDGTQTTAGEPSDAMAEAQRVQNKKKTMLLDNLIRNIDIMIYCELSVLYYMDCSILKFLLRALPHWFYFTPKPDIIPPTPPGRRPYMGTIFGTNVICILWHLIFGSPAAGEATRGYLHGGLVIDFVGQASPVSRGRLLVVDLLCMCLQVLILGVTLERRRVQGISNVTTPANLGGTQDHDAEEAGLLRSDLAVGEDIELQPLRYTTTGSSTSGMDSRGQEDAFEQSPQGMDDTHPLDNLDTGERIIANLQIWDTIRTQWQSQSVSVNSVNGTTASGVQTAATIAGRRFTVTFGGRGRRVDEG
ncbi:MAG: hypothetical protein Q9163_000042 [Psora crenata]